MGQILPSYHSTYNSLLSYTLRALLTCFRQGPGDIWVCSLSLDLQSTKPSLFASCLVDKESSLWDTKSLFPLEKGKRRKHTHYFSTHPTTYNRRNLLRKDETLALWIHNSSESLNSGLSASKVQMFSIRQWKNALWNKVEVNIFPKKIFMTLSANI